jgi:delta24(24(1))-sterol reductase
MFHEKWGFMVIFWNFAGVPFVSPRNYIGLVIALIRNNRQTYVYSVVYMASHEPEKYKFSTPVYIALFGTLLTAYCVSVAGKSPTATGNLTP